MVSPILILMKIWVDHFIILLKTIKIKTFSLSFQIHLIRFWVRVNLHSERIQIIHFLLGAYSPLALQLEVMKELIFSILLITLRKVRLEGIQHHFDWTPLFNLAWESENAVLLIQRTLLSILIYSKFGVIKMNELLLWSKIFLTNMTWKCSQKKLSKIIKASLTSFIFR